MNAITQKTRRLTSIMATAGILFALVSPNAPARDTDIYFTDPSASGLKPNVLLILDTSGSMNLEVGTTGMRRIDHMRKAMQDIIAGGTNINMGLMRFSRGEGAAVIYPLKDLDAIVADYGNLIASMQHESDDAEEDSGGDMNLTSTVLNFQSGNKVGVRFRNVYVPKDAVITSAYLTFIPSSDSSTATTVTITADDADNTPVYANTSNNITNRTQNAASVTWNVASWTNGTPANTQDITTVVQALVSKSSWVSGNAMAFKFITSTGDRRAHSYDVYPSGSFESFSPKLVINYDPPPASAIACNKTVVAGVNLGTDDAEERVSNGNMTTAQTNTNPIQLTLQSSNEQVVGVRFRNLAIPNKATIVSAELGFTIRSTNSASAYLSIYGENVDSATSFTSANYNISSRTKTTASVNWDNLPNPASGQPLNTPDIKNIVQEIVNRTGWASGNNMAFIIQRNTASGPRNVHSYETSPARAPVLRVTYQGSCASRTARDELRAAIVAMTAGGSTPIVDALYEGALYLRGNAVDYGKVRENGTSGTNTRLLRVSHPESHNGSPPTPPTGCTNADLENPACAGETISGTPNYISPVTAACQSNHIVLLTDGDATANNSTTKVRNMTGASSCSGSGDEACGVTLTTYLATQDQFTGGLFGGKQTIHTHTIGFNFSGAFLQNLATSGDGTYNTADDADELVADFQEILNQVLSDPTGFVSPSLTVNAFNRLYDQDDVYFSVFAPQLAVGWPGNVKKYRLCDKGESCIFGEVLDSNVNLSNPHGTPAIDPNTSKIKTSAKSFWSSAADGPTVEVGGAGEEIPASGSRNVYTYTGAADVPVSAVDLTATAHTVATTNSNLTKTMLGNASMSDAERTSLINWMRGQDAGDEDGDCPSGNTDPNHSCRTEQRWKFSDALHSRPVTVTYGGTVSDPVTKLFIGTNDGGLRMVNASNNATTGGQEEWIVYLPEFLTSIKNLRDNDNGEHIIGLDGAPSVLVIDNDNDGLIEPANNDKVYLYVGMRRGGRDLYAFDVTPDTNPVTTSGAVGEIKPKFLWRIKGGVAGDYAGLGQTWSYPKVATIRVKCPSGDTSCDDNDTNTPDSKKKTVLIMGGGYDPAQDAVMPAGADAMGNSIYIIDPVNGSLVWRVGGTGSGAPLELAGMQYAIPSDVGTLDSNGDGAVDRLYVGDTRGQVFRIDLSSQIDPAGTTTNDKNGGAPGSGGSNGYVFADIGCIGGTRANHCSATAKSERRKFFYAPAIVQARDTTYSTSSDYDLIAIASGDREDPLDKITQNLTPSVEPVHNRIYALRDYNYQYGPLASAPATLTDANLYNSTSNILQNPSNTGYSSELADLRSKNGWYMDLRESSSPNWVGEKGLSHPTVFNNVLYVTTYTPPSGAPVGPGTCPPPAEGKARLYGLNYLSGAGAADLNGDGTIDRFVDIGGGIPSEVVVVSREGGTTAIVGTSGGASVGSSGGGGGCTPPFCYNFPDSVSRIPTFWHDN